MKAVRPRVRAADDVSHLMSSSPVSGLKKTPLHAKHLVSGARMVDYSGWDMPVEYSGITDEHLAVRSRAGLFDVSHMGEIELAGPDALAAIQFLTSNDASRLAMGQVQYSALTTPQGGFVDDILVYRLADAHYLLVVNAANTKKDYTWIVARTAELGGDVSVVNASGRYALIALQGPESAGILQELTAIDLASLKYYWFAPGEVAGVRVTVSRTGYTGEDGFEIFAPPGQAERVWDAVMQAGQGVDIRPCGLGARDTLRLEACMRLYGNEMDESVSVLEAGLGWIVASSKPDFIGSDVLRTQRSSGVRRKLVAFEMVDRAIARHGHDVIVDGSPVGVVTSGTQTPFLKKSVGLAMVPIDLTAIGSVLEIDIRGRISRARVVPEPFYKRPKTASAAPPLGAARE